MTPSYRRCFFSQSGPRVFATTLAHALHRFPASAHALKRPSTSGYSARVDSQSGLQHSPATCNPFFRRLSLHALHATQGLFLPEWVTFSLSRSCPCRAISIRRCPRGSDPAGDGAGDPVREVAGRLGVSTYFLDKCLRGVGKTPRLVAQDDLRAENARLKAELEREEEEYIYGF